MSRIQSPNWLCKHCTFVTRGHSVKAGDRVTCSMCGKDSKLTCGEVQLDALLDSEWQCGTCTFYNKVSSRSDVLQPQCETCGAKREETLIQSSEAVPHELRDNNKLEFAKSIEIRNVDLSRYNNNNKLEIQSEKGYFKRLQLGNPNSILLLGKIDFNLLERGTAFKPVPRSMVSELTSNLPFAQHKVMVHGKIHDEPRLNVSLGCDISRDPDELLTYWYSRTPHTAYPMQKYNVPNMIQLTAVIKQYHDQLELHGDADYNFVLLNLYRNGNDKIGEHADDERTLRSGSSIISVSLGETRTFVVRSKEDKPQERVAISLRHGDVLVMSGDMQKHYKHSVPQRKRAAGQRVNLTFRSMDLNKMKGGGTPGRTKKKRSGSSDANQASGKKQKAAS